MITYEITLCTKYFTINTFNTLKKYSDIYEDFSITVEGNAYINIKITFADNELKYIMEAINFLQENISKY